MNSPYVCLARGEFVNCPYVCLALLFEVEVFWLLRLRDERQREVPIGSLDTSGEILLWHF